MPQTTTELYNLAAQLIGGRGRLTSTTQNSRYTDVFNLWYPVVRPLILCAAHWSCATKSHKMTLNKERTDGSDWADTDPSPGYKYAYTVPPDMLHPQYLSSYGHFKIGMIGDTRCIFSHEEGAILTYTFDQDNPGLWEPKLFLLMAQALAAYTAETLSGKPQLSKKLQNDANDALLQMQSYVLNEDQEPLEAVASWHAARGYTGPVTVPRYIYPYGPIVAVGQSANVK